MVAPYLGGMDMKRSSVSLDEDTHAVAKRMGNFSAFVRECLRRWNAHDLGIHIQPERADIELGKKCFPRHRKGCCVLCWPDGPPTQDDWSYYVESGGRVVVGKRLDDSPIFETRDYNNDWISKKAIENNIVPDFPIPQENTFSYKRKSRKTLGVLGHLANSLGAIFRRR
jgi:hypothetical protein